jgi:hypothetical protein
MATLPTLPASPFQRAAQRGDLAELQRLLDAGAAIKARADVAVDYGSYLQQLTPLMVAAGCDVNVRDAAGDTLLHCAASGYAHSPSWGTCGGAAEYAVSRSVEIDAVSTRTSLPSHSCQLDFIPRQAGGRGR